MENSWFIHHSAQFLFCREHLSYIVSSFIGGYSHRIVISLNEKFHKVFVSLFAEDDTYARIFKWLLDLAVKYAQIGT